MVNNPYCPQYTDSQRERVESARQRLLARWRDERFRRGQPSGFAIVHESTDVDGDRLVDVFVAAPASSRFSGEWQREVDECAATIDVEHGTRRFSLVVSHKHYLDGRRPSMDASCAARSFIHVCAAALFVYAACALA